MANTCSSNVTSGFIDLATYDELEKYMYGGPDATAYFVRETRKSTWFTQVPVVLSKASGQSQFGQDWAVTISRAGDYLLNTWLRVTLPKVCVCTSNQGAFVFNDVAALGPKRVSWTPNLMHNLIRDCCITFNDLVAARFDNFHLDFWAAFTVPASKGVVYQNMIGNSSCLTDPCVCLPESVLNLPLPFFYSRDSGVALPTAALPYNDMRINFSFRNWEDLLTTWGVAASVNPAGAVLTCSRGTTDYLCTGEPALSNVQVWANYAIVSNDERKRMACAPRDILIEQVQVTPCQNIVSAAQTHQYDVRFSHAIKVLFFAVQNFTCTSFWSNYTTDPVALNLAALPGGCWPIVHPPNGCNDNGALVDNSANGGAVMWVDPVVTTSLIYENTQRLAFMGSDYFTLVQPWYHAPANAAAEGYVGIGNGTGYHMYSYSLEFICLDPMGSTNYGKLTNVSICINIGARAQNALVAGSAGGVAGAAAGVPAALGAGQGVFPGTVYVPVNAATFLYHAQNYRFVVTAVNNNIVRISGGALGFPVL